MNLAPYLRQRFLDPNGAPLAGGQLHSYAAGTTTPQATYSNTSGTPNANPVVLDSQGYADVWLDPTLAYKFILADVNGVTQWTTDNVQISIAGLSTWNASKVYNQGELVADSATGLLYVSLTNNNLNNALTSVSNWRMFDGNVRTVSTNATLAVTDNVVRSNSTAGNLTHTLPAVASTPIGKRITVKDVGSGGNATSVKGAGTDNVDGAITYTTALRANESATFENNGTSWDVLGFSLVDGAVSTAKIAALAVTDAKIAAATITNDKIVGKTLTNASVASGIYAAAIPSAYSSSGAVTAVTLTAAASQIIVGTCYAGTAQVVWQCGFNSSQRTVAISSFDSFTILPGDSIAFTASSAFTVLYATLGNNS